MSEAELKAAVEQIVSRACSDYASGLVTGRVATRAARRAQAIADGTDAIIDLILSRSPASDKEKGNG